MSIRRIQPTLSGYELHRERSFWNLILPEETTNLLTDPSFEVGDGFDFIVTNGDSGEFHATNSDGVTRGNYCKPILLFNLNSQFAKPLTGLTIGQTYTYSFDLSADTNLYQQTMYLGVGTTTTIGEIITSSEVAISWKKSGRPKRIAITFVAQATTCYAKVRKPAHVGSSGYVYVDAMQLENKPYATTYCDGDQPGCSWLGTAHASQSYRSKYALGGRTLNFKTDLKLAVMEYQSAGMPDVDNKLQELNNSGGQYNSATVLKSRLMTLYCMSTTKNLQELMEVRQTLISAAAPDATANSGTMLRLRYQLYTSGYDKPPYVPAVVAPDLEVGTPLEVDVLYAGGLAGLVDNIRREKIALQFLELTPPSIKEPFQKFWNLGAVATSSDNYRLIRQNTDGKGQGNATAGALTYGPVEPLTQMNQLSYDPFGSLWGAGNGKLWEYPYGSNVPNVLTTNGQVYSVAFYNDVAIACGDFTVPFNRRIRRQGQAASWEGYSGGSAALYHVNVTRAKELITGGIKLLRVESVFNSGSIVDLQNGSSDAAFDNLESGGNPDVAIYTSCEALSGYVYIGGRFQKYNYAFQSQFDVNSLCRLKLKSNGQIDTATLERPPGGALNTDPTKSVKKIINLPNGDLIIAGDFATGGGLVRYLGNRYETVEKRGLFTTAHDLAINPDGSNTFWVGTDNGWYFFNGVEFVRAGMGDASTAGARVHLLATENKGRQMAFDRVSTAGNAANEFRYEALLSANNQGTSPVYPTLELKCPLSLAQTGGTLWQVLFSKVIVYGLINYTTGKRISFKELEVQPEEVIRFNLNPDELSISSDSRPNLIATVSQGSDYLNFALMPGVNRLGLLFEPVYTVSSGTPPTIPPYLYGRLHYQNTHYSFDAAALD
jgi:hypothetical protein